MTNETLNPLYSSAPDSAIPETHTTPFAMLMELSSGQPILRSHLVEIFTDTYRSPLQILEGDDCDHWLIHRVKNDQKKVIAYQLDWRHLSGDRELDAEARRERKKELKEISYKEANQGKKREPKALCELLKAKNEYFEALGEAANDSGIEEPPVKA
jgi:hypothetical protein